MDGRGKDERGGEVNRRLLGRAGRPVETEGGRPLTVGTLTRPTMISFPSRTMVWYLTVRSLATGREGSPSIGGDNETAEGREEGAPSRRFSFQLVRRSKDGGGQ